jgi:hypothetical protein
MTRCSDQHHAALKLDPDAWARLEFNGMQSAFDPKRPDRQLELRTCTCGSTLAIEVEALKLDPDTTLGDLAIVVAKYHVKSIRLCADVVDPSRMTADVTLENGRGVIRRGRTIAEALAHAFESLAVLP